MSNFYQKLCDAIGAASVREQEPMSAHTTFRAGGPARYFVTPEGEKELAAVLAACREAEKAYYILGNGSNLLVSDAGYPGVMILLGSQFTEVVCPEGEPGVYELPAGSRMYEAVEKAGGMTSEAAQEYVNLAQAIEDGQQLRIPSREEIRKYQETGKDVSGLLGAGGAAGNGSESASQKSGSSAALINLNTASKEELMTLNGIGAARAEAILSYRDQKGGFRTIEDIMKVPGIKNAAFQKIKDKITV